MHSCTLRGFYYVYFAIISVVHSQTTCFTNNETVAAFFTQCASLSSTYQACNTLNGASLNTCVCQQKVFDFIYGCENEYRSCYETYEEDQNAEYVLSNWHQECDNFVTATPTTPALTSLVSTHAPLAVCQSIESACTFGQSALQSCVDKFPGPPLDARLTDCECQSSLLSAASVCEYYGNQTCFLRPATLSNIALFQTCQTQASSFLAAQSVSITSQGGSTTSGVPFSGSSLPGATPVISNAGPATAPPVHSSASSAATVSISRRAWLLSGLVAAILAAI